MARGFYYTGGIESFISTMETSALMGMNVAQLIVDDYLQTFENEVEGVNSFLEKALFDEKKDDYVQEL